MNSESSFNNIVTQLRKVLKLFVKKIKRILNFDSKSSSYIVKIIPSKGSLKLVDVNKEMYRIIDSLKNLSSQNLSKNELRECLIDHLESLTFIENNFERIFSNYGRTQILLKISSIVRWNITTIIKIIGLLKQDLYVEENLLSMMAFLYESVWKLIIIFEEVLGVRLRLFKKKKRELTNPFKTDIYSHYIDEKQYEIELIKMIKEFDR